MHGISISEDAWKRMGERNLKLEEVFRIMFFPNKEVTKDNRIHISNGNTTVVTNMKRDYIITIKSHKGLDS
jgi:hypothetical protein